MKHLNDAQKLLDAGDSNQALDIIENILSFSPNNPQALRMKASVLDSRGYFDDSLLLLQKAAKLAAGDEEIGQEFVKRVMQDRESLIYSQLTPLGRWYFPFSPLQIFSSLFVFVGCILFLILAPSFLSKPNGSLWLGGSFVCFVLLPWILSLVLSFRGIKRIFVGFDGISVFYGFKSLFHTWDEIGSVVIEYDPDLHSNYLHMILYSRATREPLLNFDISQKSSRIRARRHFVRLMLSHIESVNYVPRGRATEFVDQKNNKAA